MLSFFIFPPLHDYFFLSFLFSTFCYFFIFIYSLFFFIYRYGTFLCNREMFYSVFRIARVLWIDMFHGAFSIVPIAFMRCSIMCFFIVPFMRCSWGTSHRFLYSWDVPLYILYWSDNIHYIYYIYSMVYLYILF